MRSDDAYKGGNGTSDGDVFHQLEIEQGVLTTNWNINDMWVRLYNCISRVNTALSVLESCDDSFGTKQQRIAEMKFLRAYGHFLLKRLYKYIPFIMNPDLTYEEYNVLSNRQFTNDEGWQQIINDLKEAFDTLPETQEELGRPTKGAAAAFLTKVYLYKAYRQDDPETNQVTSINQDDLKKVIEYSDPKYYGNYGLEKTANNPPNSYLYTANVPVEDDSGRPISYRAYPDSTRVPAANNEAYPGTYYTSETKVSSDG